MQIRVMDGRYFEIGGEKLLARSDYSVNADEGYYHELSALLKLGIAENTHFCRVGNKHDGGYVIINDNFNGGGSVFLRNQS